MSETFEYKYTEAARQRFSRMETPGLPLREPPSWSQVYVPPLIVDNSEKPVDVCQVARTIRGKHCHLWLTATRGGGKTSFLYFLARDLLENHKHQFPLPVILSLDKQTPLSEQIREAMLAVCPWEKDSPALECMLQSGKLLVMVEVLDHIRGFQEVVQAMSRFPACGWVVTSGENASVSTTLSESGFEHYAIQPLTEEQIQLFIYNWYCTVYNNDPVKKDESILTLQRALTDNRALQDFFSLRVHLYFAVTFHTFEGFLPHDRAALFKKIAKAFLSPAEQGEKKLLQRAAYKVLSESKSDFSVAELAEVFAVFGQEDDADRQVESLLCESRFLTNLPSGKKRFRYQVFRDYLAASFLFHNFITDMEKLWREIEPKTELSQWREPLLLMFALLNTIPDALQKLIDRCLARYAENENPHLLKLLGYVVVNNIELIKRQKQKIIRLIWYVYILEPTGQKELEPLLEAISEKEISLHQVLRDVKVDAWKKTAHRTVHKIANITLPMAADIHVLKKSDLSFNEHEREAINSLDRQLARIKSLLKQIKKIYAQRQYVFRPCRINQLIRECIAPGDNIEFKATAENPAVQLDSEHFKDVFLELLHNARIYTDTGKKIAVSTSLSAGRVIIVVEDSGPGVPADKKETIFEHFYSTSPQGTGVGLTYVKEIIEAHGGTIRENGIFGDGARFVATLPLTERRS